MKLETKFNIGDKVYIGDDKSRIYEVEGVDAKYFKGVGQITNYKLLRPQDGIWASEHGLSLAPVVVTNVECTHTLVYNLSSVYGMDSVTIPNGYRFKEFAEPKTGDIIISTVRANTNSEFSVAVCQINMYSPRIILEKI